MKSPILTVQFVSLFAKFKCCFYAAGENGLKWLPQGWPCFWRSYLTLAESSNNPTVVKQAAVRKNEKRRKHHAGGELHLSE